MGRIFRNADEAIIRLLSTKTDDEIVALTGCDLADVIALRALKATEPLPAEVKRWRGETEHGSPL